MNKQTKSSRRTLEASKKLAPDQSQTQGEGARDVGGAGADGESTGEGLRGVPSITISTDAEGMHDAAVKALARQGRVFCRSGELVDMPGGNLRRTPTAYLSTLLSSAARWHNVGRDGSRVPAFPPACIVDSVKAAGHWPGIPELAHAQDWPILRPDGTICEKPGYDAATKTYYKAPEGVRFEISIAPTREDARQAAARCLRFIEKNRFENDAEGRSIWLALLLTLAGRPGFGQAPAFGADGPDAQIGKTTLVKLAVGLVTGEAPATGPWIASVEEQEKRLARVWVSCRCVLFDNMTVPFGSPVIDMAITSGYVRGRPLGLSDGSTTDCTRVVWAFTGCNVTLEDDSPSRVAVLRLLEPSSAGQWLIAREDDLTEYTPHRGQVVSDCMTIIRAYRRHLDGGGAAPSRPNGARTCRFAAWDRFVREALLWIGQPDCFPAPSGIDGKRDGEQAVLEMLFQRFKSRDFKAGDIATDFAAVDRESSADHRARVELLKSLGAVLKKQIRSAIDVGNALKKLRGKRYRQSMLTSREVDRSKTYSFTSQPACVENTSPL